MECNGIFTTLKSLIKFTVVKSAAPSPCKSSRGEKINFLVNKLEFEVDGLSEIHNAFGELERIKMIINELKNLHE